MTSNPKINSTLDEANRLFLLGKLQEAISYYDKILEENPNHLGCLNNKGYALSKLKDYDSALQCYDTALKLSPNDIPVLVNASAEYDKQLAITLLKLENRGIKEWEGQDCSKLAKSNMKKIAEGMCWEFKLKADTADKDYRLTLCKMESIKQELQGYQSINKHIQDV